MHFSTAVVIMLASTASARVFTLYDDINFGGNSHRETRNDDAACCIERGCTGSNWQQRGNAFTVPGFLDNHIWSFRNQC
ncbi:hypothetical protein BDW02DRAFT_511411 [Decorospora gaudefroyi]|uniref:Uncharacterized protein n=1 Tax=Decorospora gaudefroyi TaxID=184978 RepID=A0A6A5K3H9_9PLEO|nr:hypothetical protein BDW02DRAFT_511411 [Decorospora gaudefroyi]